MDLSTVVMWFGFILAAYSVVGNDVIQTLGTFLTSNEKKVKWYILWAFAATLLAGTLIYGQYQGDITYDRLDKFTIPEVYEWYYILPPLVLLSITRFGIPVSTTFLILTLFSLQNIPNDLPTMMESLFNAEVEVNGAMQKSVLNKMVTKSIMGYIIAFITAIVVYLGISKLTEKRFIDNPIQPDKEKFWIAAQWATTGFLWVQWLTQDLANIYAYLRGGVGLDTGSFILSLFILVGLLAYIFYQRGGAVQNVVREKTNTGDIRSATFVDGIYGLLLLLFKEDIAGLFDGKLPMSTTWVFIGLLAGRELAIRIRLEKRIPSKVAGMVFADLGKVFFGLLISVVLVFAIKLMSA